MRRVHVGKMELNGSTPRRGLRRAKNGIIAEKTHFYNIICPSLLRNRGFAHVTWTDSFSAVTFFPAFLSLGQPFPSRVALQCHSCQALIPLNIWEALDSERMLQRNQPGNG